MKNLLIKLGIYRPKISTETLAQHSTAARLVRLLKTERSK